MNNVMLHIKHAHKRQQLQTHIKLNGITYSTQLLKDGPWVFEGVLDTPDRVFGQLNWSTHSHFGQYRLKTAA